MSLQRFASLPALALVALLLPFAYLLDLSAGLPGALHPAQAAFLLELLVLLQLLAAWRLHPSKAFAAVAYLLVALMAFRYVYGVVGNAGLFWCFRIDESLGALGYGFPLLWFTGSVIALHPACFHFFKQKSPQWGAWLAARQRWVVPLVLLGMVLLFALLSSRHITRDGMDWVQRIRLADEWHRYLRSPLIIGLYRLAYWSADQLAPVHPLRVIAGLSIASGVWGLWWVWQWTRLRAMSPWHTALTLGLLIASGGWFMLYFGHIEVYPILLAGWMPLFYYTERYARGGSAVWVGGWLAVSFALHLSTGWLLPAFLLLPILLNGVRKSGPDLLGLWGAFVALQALFWGWLIVFEYGASLSAFGARLHETFFVGLDRAMFVPAHAWFDLRRLWLLLNEYLYLSPGLLMLLPLTLARAVHGRDAVTRFWLLAAGFYAAYSFFWNPDRGFPEDWDLFSPLTPLVAFATLHIAFTPRADEPEGNEAPLYLAIVGTLPFALQQVAHHHLTSFLFF